jgi:predicted dienelactone hydrolase
MKKSNLLQVLTLMIGLTLSACNPQPGGLQTTVPKTLEPPAVTQVSSITQPATATLPPITPVKPPATTTIPLATRTPAPFPLSGSGPYWPGNRVYSLVDDNRNGRKINIQIYYPALKEPNDQGGTITRDAVPDMSDAPYPLVLTGPHSGDMLFKSHLTSYGFVMVIVRFPDLNYEDNWDFGVIDHPRDLIFTLNQIASDPPEGLEGVIDTKQVGVSGYSWDGFFSLAVSGVRIDPAYYLSHCQQPPLIEPTHGAEWYLRYTCSLAKEWDEFADHVGDEITASEDGLWQPVTDERIRAVVPMAADGAWLYGERGLAAVDRPVLMISPTEDEFTPYQIETKFIFEHLGTPQKSMISYIGKSHMMVEQSVPSARLKHFVTAYFGYYLQGREDYLAYFSEDFVAQYDDLVWGIYSGD